MVLIKENHLRPLTLEQLQKNTLRARQATKVKIEIEAENLEQVKEFLTLPVDIIMLDNMSLPQLRKAVALRKKINPAIQLEASGNVSARTIKAIAKTGVDYISCGAITHSAQAFDVSLLVDAS